MKLETKADGEINFEMDTVRALCRKTKRLSVEKRRVHFSSCLVSRVRVKLEMQ